MNCAKTRGRTGCPEERGGGGGDPKFGALTITSECSGRVANMEETRVVTLMTRGGNRISSKDSIRLLVTCVTSYNFVSLYTKNRWVINVMGSPINVGGQYPFITFFTLPNLSGKFLLLANTDAQSVWKELSEHMRTSSKGASEKRRLTQYVTNTVLDDNFKGTTEQFILH